MDAARFSGLQIGSDGSAPSVRHTALPSGPEYDRKRMFGRATQGKVWNNMERRVNKLVQTAMANKVVLAFRMRDLEQLRQLHKIPVIGGGALAQLEGPPRRLTVENGPIVVVDLDDVPVFWYFPRFIGAGLQRELLHKVADLGAVYRPEPDHATKDRRTQCRMSDSVAAEPAPAVRVTRSRAKEMSKLTESERGQPSDATEPRLPESPCSSGSAEYAGNGQAVRLFGLGASQPSGSSSVLLMACEGTDDPIEWTAPSPKQTAPDPAEAPALVKRTSIQALSELDPFAYYFSPGWFQTGMETTRAIAMSVHFRDALEPECSRQMIAFLEAKRLYDRQLGHLVRLINEPLNASMLAVRARMVAVTGPTSVALRNGWTSAFPCFGVGVNRVSRLHRDTKGFRAGMDVIGVLGTFVGGGDLKLPDLNLHVEWTPGCLGAFDGYDLRHEVAPWKGGCRVALISFCR